MAANSMGDLVGYAVGIAILGAAVIVGAIAIVVGFVIGVAIS